MKSVGKIGDSCAVPRYFSASTGRDRCDAAGRPGGLAALGQTVAQPPRFHKRSEIPSRGVQGCHSFAYNSCVNDEVRIEKTYCDDVARRGRDCFADVAPRGRPGQILDRQVRPSHRERSRHRPAGPRSQPAHRRGVHEEDQGVHDRDRSSSRRWSTTCRPRRPSRRPRRCSATSPARPASCRIRRRSTTYMRLLEKSTPRVKVFSIGTTRGRARDDRRGGRVRGAHGEARRQPRRPGEAGRSAHDQDERRAGGRRSRRAPRRSTTSPARFTRPKRARRPR